jgi:hypothetical protein
MTGQRDDGSSGSEDGGAGEEAWEEAVGEGAVVFEENEELCQWVSRCDVIAMDVAVVV